MTDFQKIDTWQGLVALLIVLVVIYFLLNVLEFVLERFLVKNKTNKRLKMGLDKEYLLYVDL